MNDINNFNENKIGPDPINTQSVPKLKPAIPVKNSKLGIDSSFKFVAIVLSVFLIVWGISIAFNLVSQIQGQGEVVTNDSKGNISVSAEASVYVEPDTVSVIIGVKDMGQVMETVSQMHNQKIQNIINFLTQAGIPADNIKTVNFSIEPEYQKQTEGVDLNEYPEGKVIITGYSMTTKMQISTNDIDNIGKYIQIALDQQANTVSSPIFSVENDEQYIVQAREEAINKAKLEAEQIAQKLGVSLGSIQNYNDYSNKGDDSYKYSGMGGEESNGLSIAPGTNKITVNVYIDYTLK